VSLETPEIYVFQSKKDHQFYFHLRGINGAVQDRSQGYATEEHAVEGAEAAQRNYAAAIIVTERGVREAEEAKAGGQVQEPGGPPVQGQPQTTPPGAPAA
jgi:uncharacterized protein YegP (UPF0339 family)